MKEVQGRRGKSSPSDATESRKKAAILSLGLGAGIPSPRRQPKDFPTVIPIPREPHNNTNEQRTKYKKTPVHPDNMSATSNTMDPYSILHCNSITDRLTRQNIFPRGSRTGLKTRIAYPLTRAGTKAAIFASKSNRFCNFSILRP